MLKCEYQRVKDKLKKALESNCESITIRLTYSNLHGEDVIAITKSQPHRLMKAYEAYKGMIIKMSKTQLAYNVKIEGEFVLMLTVLIPFLTCNCHTSFRGGSIFGPG